jgi:hypothetical protein
MEKLWINSTVCRAADAREIAEEFADRNRLRGRERFYLGLMVEETMSMALSMMKHFEGELWIENAGKGYRVILEAAVREGEPERNVPGEPVGFMAKIAEMMDCGYVFENAADVPEALAGMLPDYMSYGMRGTGDGPCFAGEWSLSACRRTLEEKKHEAGAGLIQDELEKSIVARIADDVTVGIKGQRLRLVLLRNPRG